MRDGQSDEAAGGEPQATAQVTQSKAEGSDAIDVQAKEKS
jgi:hypothetical protein